MRLIVPSVPPSPNRVLGKHWSAKAGTKNEWIMWIRSAHIPIAEPKARIKKRVTILICHSRLYDKDNAYASVKPVVDALKHWALIYDDSEQWLELYVEQAKCSHANRYTEIVINDF